MQCDRREKNGQLMAGVPHSSPAIFVLNPNPALRRRSRFPTTLLKPSFSFYFILQKERRGKKLLKEGRVISLPKRSCVSYCSHSHEQHAFKDINIYIGNKQLSLFFPLKKMCMAQGVLIFLLTHFNDTLRKQIKRHLSQNHR